MQTFLNNLQDIYISFIKPILEYADIVWEKLESIQMEASHIVTGVTKFCSKTQFNYDTGWVPLRERRSKQTVIKFLQKKS